MSPSLHQYRLPPVPVPITVAVDGSDPEALGVVWAPRTAVGGRDVPGGDGDAVERADVVATGGLCVTVAGELGEGLARA